jgi:hypothetical protein
MATLAHRHLVAHSALHRRPRIAARSRRKGRPVWLTIALAYGVLTLIVVSIIALDYAAAYLVAGGPPN